MTTITTIHAYRFNLDKSDEAEAWKALKRDLKGLGLKPHTGYCNLEGDDFERAHIQPLNGQPIALETEHLFQDQWNTAPTATSDKGLRVFDWRQVSPYPNQNQKIRRGHWLEQTAEMRELRRNTMKCGYCGKQEAAAKGYVFCPHCLGSEYLKETDVIKGATRLRPIDAEDRNWTPLTDAERDHLLPLYRAEQIGQGSERSRKRAELIAEHDKTVRIAARKRDGFLWLMNHGLNTDNVIYYPHTDRFSFGWRKPITEHERGVILAAMGAEFPFRYEIKCEDGHTLQNE